MIQGLERLTRQNWKLSLHKEMEEISYNKQLLITAAVFHVHIQLFQ